MMLSVVVTIVDGGAALDRCLAALATQENPPPLEVLVPWDDTVPGIAALSARYPSVRFVGLGTVPTKEPAGSPRGQHELFDRRRSAGLAAASGDTIGLIEDRNVPRRNWARTVTDLHQRLGYAVIGGSVGWRGVGLVSWAVYACDLGRYDPESPPGPREYVTDTNVSYSRTALDTTRNLWADRYHETTVHWALRRDGAVLWFAPELRVDQVRDSVEWRAQCRERVAWGRLFAATRAAEAALPRRLLLAAGTPVLPTVLAARIAARELRRAPARVIRALPALLLLLAAWSAGECIGYVTGRG